MVRFIHTADIHLGKRFGQMPEELRGRLMEARHESIGRLTALARSHGAEAVLVAGDIFDTETPSAGVRRQALQAMAAEPSLRWLLMPGNHDSLAADQLWDDVARDLPPNVFLALTPDPIPLFDVAVVLPAPCSTRRPGRDLTEWMSSAETASDAIRIGVAHGAVQEFGEEGARNVIAADRAEKASLDYLALGDWHGHLQITERTWYSGAPEPDRFRHNTPGVALVVSIESRGALPEVTPVEIGKFRWQTVPFSLLPYEDPTTRIAELLSELPRLRDTLLLIEVEGRARLPEHTALEAAFDNAAPDFAWLEVRDDALGIEYEVADLDAIDQAGALRQAAEVLFAEAHSPTTAPSDARIAQAALSRLYAHAVEET